MKSLIFIPILFLTNANSISQITSDTSCYDEYEIDMIASADRFMIKPTGTIYEFKGGESVTFKYWESENTVSGELVVKGVVCQVYGISEGEGGYFGAVWHNGENKGVITWGYSDSCMTIFNKIDCKNYQIDVCKEKAKSVETNSPFGNHENSTNKGSKIEEGKLDGKSSGSGIDVRSIFDDPAQKRFAVAEPNFRSIKVSNDTNLHLKLVVNPDGSIKSVEHRPRLQDMENDEQLVGKIVQETMKTLKYNKSSSDQTMTIFVTLRFFR
jgi:hypothetical protein